MTHNVAVSVSSGLSSMVPMPGRYQVLMSMSWPSILMDTTASRVLIPLSPVDEAYGLGQAVCTP